jgi:peptidyl-prolyl cis-trans isomerase C
MRKGALAAGLVIALGCGRGEKGSTVKPRGDVVAKIGDREITVAEVEAELNRQPHFARARFSAPERKKEFLENLVRFEAMAAEARSRGYDRDPDVQRVMKQQMITQLVQKEFDAKLKPEDVPDADVEKYYRENPDEFTRQEEVRVSQIFTKEKGKAQKAAAEAKAAAKGDQKAFRDLVTRYSEDEDSKQRGGDLTFFDRKTTMYPGALVEAAFELTEVNDVSGPVQTDKGWHVLKLTQRRPGFSRPLPEVKHDIQRRLYQQMRTKRMEQFVAEMRSKLNVQIYENELEKVTVTAPAPGAVPAAANQPLPPGSKQP